MGVYSPTQTDRRRLIENVEQALAQYLGVSDGSFPSDQWPNVAATFANAVHATAVTEASDPYVTAEKARTLVYTLGDLNLALARIVE